MVTTASPEEIAYLARAAGFHGQGLTNITAVSLAESSGDVYAIGSGSAHSIGLAQINSIAQHSLLSKLGIDIKELFNPLVNLKVAYAVSNGGTDFSPWTTYNSGAYKQFLPVASSAANKIESLPTTAINTYAPILASQYKTPTSVDLPNRSVTGGGKTTSTQAPSWLTNILNSSGAGVTSNFIGNVSSTGQALGNIGNDFSNALSAFGYVAESLVGAIMVLAGLTLLALGSGVINKSPLSPIPSNPNAYEPQHLKNSYQPKHAKG